MLPDKNPSEWINNTVEGTVSTVTATLDTQSGSVLTTQSNLELDLNPNGITPRPESAWTLAARVDTAWMQPQNTATVTVGNELFTTNSGSFLVDNSGDFIVTTSTYQHPKYATAWTETAAV